MQGDLTVDIQYTDNGAHYLVRNNTGIDLEDVTVVSQTGYHRIPLLESGEEASGEVEQFEDYSGGSYSSYYGYGGGLSYWGVINELYGQDQYNYGMQLPRELPEDELRENYLKAQIVNAMMENMSLQGQATPYGGAMDNSAVWGWSSELGELRITSGGKELKNHLNRAVVIGAVNIDYEGNGEIAIPLGQILGVVEDASNSAAQAHIGENQAYFTDGDVTFAFSLPGEVKDYRIDHLMISSSYAYGTFRTMLFNTSTEEWDEYDLDMQLSGDDVEHYIDPNGKVLMKVTSDMDGADVAEYTGSDISIDYPTIFVSGKEK